jgi:hypothetical protein
VAIVVDDADELKPDDFAELKALLSLRADGKQLLQLVLVGSPVLSSALKPLRQRVRAWAQVSPLANEEVEAYIEHKLSAAGSLLRGLFKPAAVARIAAYSRGVPRTIDALCDRALQLAFLRSQDPITEQIVEDAWKVLQDGSEAEAETSSSTDARRSEWSSEPETETRKQTRAMAAKKISDQKFKAPAPGGATAAAIASRAWFPPVFQRLTPLIPNRKNEPAGRLLIEKRSYPAVAAMLLLAALAAAAIFRPARDRQAQPEWNQEANVMEQSQAALPAPVGEEKSVEAEPVEEQPLQATAAKTADMVGSGDGASPQPERRTAAARQGELVYLHTSQPEDFRALADISAVLRSEGFIVRDTRFTKNSTQGDVRFFFAGDRRAAERVKSVVEQQLQTRGYSRRLQLLERDGRKFQFAAPGKIEVWLPPLTSAG